MNRLLVGAVTAAGSLTLASGFMMGAAAPAVAGGGSPGNSAYGISAVGPIPSLPLAQANASGPTMVTASHLILDDILSTGLTQDNAGLLTAFSRVGSVDIGVDVDEEVGTLTATQVESSCRSDNGNASASIVNGVMNVNGRITHLPQHPFPNETLALADGLGELILNQQIDAPGGGTEVQGIEVDVTATNPDEHVFIATSVCTSPGDLGNTVTVTNPGGKTNDELDTITPLHIAATDSDPGQTLTYSATGLPSGLSINPATGVISGTVGADDNVDSPYTVTVTATDTTGASGSTTFQWVIDVGV
jgi:hypothetical protein